MCDEKTKGKPEQQETVRPPGREKTGESFDKAEKGVPEVRPVDEVPPPPPKDDKNSQQDGK